MFPDNANDNQPPLMAPKDAEKATTLSRVTLAAMAADGLFPKPVALSERRYAYVRAEVQQWISERVAARAAA